jgi:hypothetical protein
VAARQHHADRGRPVIESPNQLIAPSELTANDISWELAAIEAPASNDDDLLVRAVTEAQSYRLLAQSALHALHEVTLERDVLRGQRILDLQRQRKAAA